MKTHCILIAMTVLTHTVSRAQDSLQLISGKALDKFEQQTGKKSQKLYTRMDETTQSYILNFKKEEEKLNEQLKKTNPAEAEKLYGDIGSRYNKILRLMSPGQKQNGKAWAASIPHLDTIKNALLFIDKYKSAISSTANTAGGKLSSALQHVDALGSEFSKADQVSQLLNERTKFLEDQYTKLGISKQLNDLNKKAYYFGEQVKIFKENIKDVNKAEQTAISMLSQLPAYKKFLQKNSYLASIFGQPGDYNISADNLTGLQTRAVVQEMMNKTMSAGGNSAQQQAMSGMQSAQMPGTEIFNKIQSLRHQASPEDMSFKPNNQKTKTFFQRLQFGADVQFGKVYNFMPLTSDIALSIGYKFSNKGTVGAGLAYKLGLGNGLNDVHMSSQGAGIRTYLDWKISKNIYLSGGYEWNYLSAFNSVDQLRSLGAWKQSGLIGISRKYQVSNKVKGKVQLLFDVLSFQNVPKTQPVLFRVGWDM